MEMVRPADATPSLVSAGAAPTGFQLQGSILGGSRVSLHFGSIGFGRFADPISLSTNLVSLSTNLISLSMKGMLRKTESKTIINLKKRTKKFGR
jgi:hypothetical protein